MMNTGESKRVRESQVRKVGAAGTQIVRHDSIEHRHTVATQVPEGRKASKREKKTEAKGVLLPKTTLQKREREIESLRHRTEKRDRKGLTESSLHKFGQ